MIKKVSIDGKDVELKVTAALPFHYRKEYGSDFYRDMREFYKTATDGTDDHIFDILVDIENSFAGRLIYLAGKAANKNIPDTLGEWMEEFDEPQALAILLNGAMEAYGGNAAVTSTAKKNRSRPNGK